MTSTFAMLVCGTRLPAKKYVLIKIKYSLNASHKRVSQQVRYNIYTFLLWNEVPLTLTGDSGRAIIDGFIVVGEFNRGYDVERVDIVDSFRLSSSLESALAGTLVEWTDFADPELIDPVPANSITRHLVYNHTNLYFVGTDKGKNCRVTFKFNTIGLTVIYMLTYLLGTINPQIIDKMS